MRIAVFNVVHLSRVYNGKTVWFLPLERVVNSFFLHLSFNEVSKFVVHHSPFTINYFKLPFVYLIRIHFKENKQQYCKSPESRSSIRKEG